MFFYLDYFYCLYEIEETEFVQSAMNHFTELKLTHHTFTKMDHIVLQFCIKNCCKLESVCLENSTFLTEDLNENSPGAREWPHRAQHQDELHHSSIYLLCQALKASNCNLKKLSLGSCGLTAAGFGDLATVLSTSRSLTKVDLGANNPGDAGVQLLCEGLKQLNCKLQSLRRESRLPKTDHQETTLQTSAIETPPARKEP
ncbi:NACHT, LRR and PYD domains-containing protein 3-like isoform 2-T2 [Pangshura tecta]